MDGVIPREQKNQEAPDGRLVDTQEGHSGEFGLGWMEAEAMSSRGKRLWFWLPGYKATKTHLAGGFLLGLPISHYPRSASEACPGRSHVENLVPTATLWTARAFSKCEPRVLCLGDRRNAVIAVAGAGSCRRCVCLAHAFSSSPFPAFLLYVGL